MAHAARATDLEALLKRHLPRDSDSAINSHLINLWLAKMRSAESVRVEWVESYGRKLKASWLDPAGHTLLSTARPAGRADSVRDFVADWANYRQRHGLRYHVFGDDGTSQRG